MGKKGKGNKGKGGLVLASMNGNGIAPHGGNGGPPQLKQGATDDLWEAGTSFGVSKVLKAEIASIYAEHNLVVKLVKIDEKKPADEAGARKKVRGLLVKVALGGIGARRFLANNGDISRHVATGAMHQAAGEAAGLV